MTIFKINRTTFEVSPPPPPIHYHISSHNSGKHISINIKFIIFKHIGCGRGTSNARGVNILKYGGQGNFPQVEEKRELTYFRKLNRCPSNERINNL